MKTDGGQKLMHGVIESARGGPSRGWLAATIGLCVIVGVIPFDQALGNLEVPHSLSVSLRWQACTAITWMSARRGSFNDVRRL